MQVYLAGPWVDRERAANIALELIKAKHVITHPWWQYEGEGEHKESDASLRRFAQLDVDGVTNADVIVVINTAKSEGKATEQGIAIAQGKPIIVLTPGEKPTSNIFHHLPKYLHVKTLDEVLFALECMEVLGG